MTHSSIRSKRAFFARQTLRTEFLSWREQAKSRRSGRLLCFWHNWTSRRPLTTSNTPLRPQDHNRKGHQSSCSRYSTSGGPRATFLSAWRGSPVTNASLSSGVSRREPQSRLQCLWLFLIMSWRTWMLGGETETSIGKWTTSTSRALLTLTTCVFWRQAQKILS